MGQGSPESQEEGHAASRRTSRRAVSTPSPSQRQGAELWEEATTGTASQGASEDRDTPTGTAAANPPTRDDWAGPTEPVLRDAEEEEFVNGVVPDYEDSNEPGSAMDLPTEAAVMATRPPPVLLELRWLPPRPPTSYDGFNIYIARDGRKGGGACWSGTAGGAHLLSHAGNVTQTASVDQNTHQFFTELSQAGTYRIQVTTLSSAGQCEARESSPKAGFTFYLGALLKCPPAGCWFRFLLEPPAVVCRPPRRAVGGAPGASSGRLRQTAGLQHRRRLLGPVPRGPQRERGVGGVHHLSQAQCEAADGAHLLQRGMATPTSSTHV